MPDPDRVCAVVVTHDRRELLRRCLRALAGQTAPLDHVLVVDNASVDGSGDMVREEFPDAELVRLDHNAGGAGGFHDGMHRAHATGAERIWLMDDDTIGSETALEELLRASVTAPDAMLLASKAVWTHRRPPPMNPPGPARR